jgi:hypothetical protein
LSAANGDDAPVALAAAVFDTALTAALAGRATTFDASANIRQASSKGRTNICAADFRDFLREGALNAARFAWARTAMTGKDCRHRVRCARKESAEFRHI